MLEGPLSFPIVVKAELVDRAITDRPSMTDVVLLESFVRDRSKTRHIRARRLELRKRRDDVMVVEVIVEAEILSIIDAVIKLDRKLISAIRLNRSCYDHTAAI